MIFIIIPFLLFICSAVFVNAYGMESQTARESEEKISQDSRPSVRIEPVKDQQTGGNDFFTEPRSLEFILYDEEEYFDEDAAVKGLHIQAKDAHGKKLTVSAEAEGGWRTSGNIHRAVFSFKDDAFYELSFSYKNKAGGTAQIDKSMSELCSFAVDCTPPEALIRIGEGRKWKGLQDEKPGYVFCRSDAKISARDSADNISGIKEIFYYQADADKTLSAGELEELYKKGSFSKKEPAAAGEEGFIVYARVSDRAGNVSYCSTPAIGVDDVPCLVDFDMPKAGQNGYYTSDIKVGISVADKDSKSGGISGIREIKYQVMKGSSVTQEGYIFKAGDGEDAPVDISEIVKNWKENIVIDAARNDSDHVSLRVAAADRAGNIRTKEVQISVCSSRPRVDINFTGEEGNVIGGCGYFPGTRTAQITITDRESVFDRAAFENGIRISRQTGKDADVSDVRPAFSPWEHKGSKHKVSLVFEGDAHYTWDITYKNKAGLEADVKDKAPKDFNFTVDTQTPEEGKIEIGDTEWTKFLSAPVFDNYTRFSAETSLSGRDSLSPLTIEYYINRSGRALKEKELDSLDFNSYTEKLHITDEGRWNIYMRLTDAAGNKSYFCSGGYVTDHTLPEADIHTDGNSSRSGIFSSRVDAAVRIRDSGAGIKYIEYSVIKDGRERTQGGRLFDFDGRGKPCTSHDSVIVVDPEKNNSSNVLLSVTVEDNAGNLLTEERRLDIDITRPAAAISYDNNNVVNKKYFHAPRRAVLTVIERREHFNKKEADRNIKIHAVDREGRRVVDAYRIGEWKTEAYERDSNKDRHTIEITFSKDALYSLEFSCQDMAGNRCRHVTDSGQKAAFQFVIDRVSPSAEVSAESSDGRKRSWKDLDKKLRYEVISPGKISLSGIFTDKISGIGSIECFKKRLGGAGGSDKIMKAPELDRVEKWGKFQNIYVNPGEKCLIYVRVSDKAGNYRYLCTGGMICDGTKPEIVQLAPDKQQKGRLFNGDVPMRVSVREAAGKGAGSGIRSVECSVQNEDSGLSKKTLLFSSGEGDVAEAGLKQKWKGHFLVPAASNNSNRVKVIIKVTDHAGNAREKIYRLGIDTSAPRIWVRYDNNRSENEKYFNRPRTAVVTIFERNFDPDKVRIDIRSSSGKMPGREKWIKSDGTGNGDNARWITRLRFFEDSEYDLKISCTDAAGSKSDNIAFAEDTKAGSSFVIDRGRPKISVRYDNNSFENREYYRAGRKANILIEDSNFSPADVEIKVKGVKDGRKVDAPVPGRFTGRNGRFSASIVFDRDARYNLEISCRDKAGNREVQKYTDNFTIDSKAPDVEISGVKDRAAYRGKVQPRIKVFDDNIDRSSIRYELTRENRGAVPNRDVISQGKGCSVTYESPEISKDRDDIYYLEVYAKDRSGNETTKSLKFLVNRFGSLYYCSKKSFDAAGKYTNDIGSIDITEINVCPLRSECVTLFEGGMAKELEEGRDYSVRKVKNDKKWHEYRYNIFKKNFHRDGVYGVLLRSLDEAGNISVNDMKTAEIKFGVDTTAPKAAFFDLESGKKYPESRHLVRIAASDNLKLCSLKIFLDGKEYKKWEGDQLTGDRQHGVYSFSIYEGKKARRDITAEAVDGAGNRTRISAKGVYIGRSAGKEDFYRRICLAFSAGATGILLLVLFRRRKICRQ